MNPRMRMDKKKLFFKTHTMKMHPLPLSLLLVFSSFLVTAQSKKDLRSTVSLLQADSLAKIRKLAENASIIANLNSENINLKATNSQMAKQLEEVTNAYLIYKTSTTDTINRLKDAIAGFNEKLDSLNRYARIVHFINTFYKSLETSEDENMRQYKYGANKFDLDNFNSLISRDARYSAGRVKNLSDEKNHQKFYIELQSIEEIKFGVDKILVRTKVMYTGDKMGLFYNEEQLTMAENKGLLKLTDWVDLDLYNIMPSMDATVENVTREDFYKWIDGKK